MQILRNFLPTMRDLMRALIPWVFKKIFFVEFMLMEFNDAVKAKFVESPETLIESMPLFFSQFTLIIATQVNALQNYFTNGGNPHALGQKPLTFPRQVVALCQAPFLLDDPNVGLVFPADAIARARHYLSLTSGGLVDKEKGIMKITDLGLGRASQFLSRATLMRLLLSGLELLRCCWEQPTTQLE